MVTRPEGLLALMATLVAIIGLVVARAGEAGTEAVRSVDATAIETAIVSPPSLTQSDVAARHGARMAYDLRLAGAVRAGRQVGEDLGAKAHPDLHIRRFEDLPSYVDRRLRTPDSPYLAKPTSGEFVATVQPVPADVLARSTWQPGCPVGVDDLRHVTVTHLGFDGLAHTGELMVNRRAADQFVEVFRELYEARYPIERMWVTTMAELDERDWTHGVDNNTGAFVCRQKVGGGAWSQHAYGLAVDINPYHNPYVRGDWVVPSHATSYLQRDDRPGIIQPGDVAVTAFARMGWHWGGYWSSALDYMHFSHNDR